MLSSQEQEILLKLARESLIHYFNNTKIPLLDNETLANHSQLSEPRGCFVTLRTKKEDKLRGCIGIITSNTSLYQNVSEYAVTAATEDSRFQPVETWELGNLKIEISVLSLPKKISSLKEIVLGEHGIIITKDGRRAVYLPQVPIEWNWNKQQYLEQLSLKAGLPKDAYLEDDAVLEVFTAEMFEE